MRSWALEATSRLIDLCLEDASEKVKEERQKFASTKEWAKDLLVSGQALAKMKEIIKAQGGDAEITSAHLRPGKYMLPVKSEKSGKIKGVSSHSITTIAKILGAPADRRAGLFLNKRIGDHIENDEELFTMHSDSEYRLSEASDSLSLFPIFTIQK